MENFRIVLAIVLSMAVLLIWQHFFAPTQQVGPPQPQAVSGQDALQPEFQAEPTPSAFPAAIADTEKTELARPARIITVRTPLYTATFSERGAALTNLTLTEYREELAEDSPPKQLLSLPLDEGSLVTSFEKGSLGNLESEIFDAMDAPDIINANQHPRQLAFTWTSSSGIIFEKVYEFAPDSYAMNLVVNIKNEASYPLTDSLAISLKNTVPTDKRSRIVFSGPCALINNSAENIKVTAKKPAQSLEGFVGWIGITWRYFMSALIFEEPQNGSLQATYYQTNDMVVARYLYPSITISPGQTHSVSQRAFFGPKTFTALNPAGLNKALDFGWFHFIARPCLWLMNQMYKVIPNYGLAIILLTLLIKIVLWPLGTKSYRSMNKMKKLQPLMQEIREKHKSDKTRMNQEVFALYKTFKVNPMSGCLPMVLQIPVFLGLYRMLYGAIELRQSPFFWWISDLAAPDRLFHFSFSIPGMQAPCGIPVLTIIMGASMFLQQKMAPPPGDPAQAKMMMALPIVFTFIFVNFPSGLVLYWLVNNLFSMAQQYYISRTES